MRVGGRGFDRERVLRILTFWLRPAFALRVVHRFQRIAGFDRAVALASSALTALIRLADQVAHCLRSAAIASKAASARWRGSVSSVRASKLRIAATLP